VVDVSDAVDEAHDLPLERRRLAQPRVVQDPVPRLGGQVQPAPVPLQHLDDPERVLVVAEAPPEALRQHLVQRLLARVPEGRVPEVVPERDRLGEVLVQPERAGDRAGDARGLERMREPRSVMVALGGDEDLRLVLEAPEGLGVDDAVAVPLEGRPQATFLLFLVRPPARLVRAHGERREPALLPLSNAFCERIRYSSCDLRHRSLRLVSAAATGAHFSWRRAGGAR